MRTVEIGSAARALTPISTFNNLFLITAIYSIAGAAEDLIRGRLGVGMLVGYALLAPPLWLAWRTMDPIRAVFSKLGFWIYIYTAVLASAVALMGLSVLTQQEDVSAFVALSCVIYVPFAFAAAFGIQHLKKGVIAPFGLSFTALMDRAGENSPRQKTAKCPRLNPKRGLDPPAARPPPPPPGGPFPTRRSTRPAKITAKASERFRISTSSSPCWGATSSCGPAKIHPPTQRVFLPPPDPPPPFSKGRFPTTKNSSLSPAPNKTPSSSRLKTAASLISSPPPPPSSLSPRPTKAASRRRAAGPPRRRE